MKTELTKSNEAQRFAVRPRVDVFENDREYLVIADVPGVAKDAIDVRFEDGELRLEARRWLPADAQQPLSEEYRVADYRRAFAMPEGVDADKIEAELTNGVLKVHLPKSETKRPRRIDIRTS
jgi:HSP20 family molecular chaperone IbpA